MLKHVVGMIAAIMLIVGCMVYPFLPGDYDGLAVTLSVMAQFFAMAGLVLVPIGLAWLAYELRARTLKRYESARRGLGAVVRVGGNWG